MEEPKDSRSFEQEPPAFGLNKCKQIHLDHKQSEESLLSCICKFFKKGWQLAETSVKELQTTSGGLCWTLCSQARLQKGPQVIPTFGTKSSWALGAQTSVQAGLFKHSWGLSFCLWCLAFTICWLLVSKQIDKMNRFCQQYYNCFFRLAQVQILVWITLQVPTIKVVQHQKI